MSVTPQPSTRSERDGLSVSASTRKLSKDLAKGSKEALDLLMGIIRDEKADPKHRLDAGKFVIAQHISLTEAMSKQQIQNQLLALKKNPTLLKDVTNSATPTATYDPFNLRRVEGVVYDSDLPEDGVVDLTTFNGN